MSPVLEIERCDLNIIRNKTNHHTDQFEDERLIVRRGQPFSVSLHLKPDGKGFASGESAFTLTVETADTKPKDTKVCFGLSKSTVGGEWSASAAPGSTEDTVILTINSSPDAPIGVYSLSLDQDGHKTSLGQFTLLFNAWCQRDSVYMRLQSRRQEYVLSQHGLIYKGTTKWIKALPWNFGQFEAGILDICFKILDDNPKSASDADQDRSARRNPVYVIRVLSAMINSQDDNGVLVGNWGKITNGVQPGHWIGSGDILQQWAKSGPVRYGQCWVFAAVACTVSRALGIPCRAVTNFNSAHDTDGNLLIERKRDVNLKRLGSESIWNFHVWVESWMTRPDLGNEFDGWQASDPTPQETSEGVYCCGPCPLKAIKEGELTKKYDAPFIFAEVNADVVDLMQLPNGEFTQCGGDTKSVGCFISTKAVGLNERHDITHKYKYPEGSKEERQVFEKAQHRSKLQQKGLEPGLLLKIKLVEGMIIGDDFEVYAILTNNCMDARTCNFIFRAVTIGYNGKHEQSCAVSSVKVDIAAGEEIRLPLKLEYRRYSPVLNPDRLIQVLAHATSEQTMNFCRAEKTIVLDEPKVNIKLIGDVRVKASVTAELTLVNPLPEPLQNCSFTIEGVGLTGNKPLEMKVEKVMPKKEAKARVEFTPTLAGSTVLLVNFDSNKLKDIKSFINVKVKQERTAENWCMNSFL